MTDSSDGLPDLLESPPQEMQGLLEAYRAQTHRSGAQVESALQSVTAQVGAASATAAAATGLSTTGKVGLAATLLGVVGVIGLAVASPSPQPEPSIEAAVTSTPTSVRVVEEVEPESVEPEASPAPAPPTEENTSAAPVPAPAPKPRAKARSKAKAKVLPPKPAPTSTLTEELRRLQQARAALRGGTPARARALIQSHRRNYPNSTLARERDATEVAALCAEDRDADAKGKAAAFAKAYPGSSQDLLADCDD